jgi:hypothetical protein
MPKHEENTVLRRLEALEKTVTHGFAALQAVVSTLQEQSEDLLTTEDVVTMTGRPYQTVIRDKSIPFNKRGKRRYYRKSDVIKHFLGEMHGASVAELKEQAALMIANRTR